MTTEHILDQVRQYYERKLACHGTTPAGVDWNSEDGQRMRFRSLLRLLDLQPQTSIIDYGCGYGALAAYLREQGHRGSYVGYDLSEEMTAAAARLAPDQACTFTSHREQLTPADFALASGIFNVKQQTPIDQWRQYVITTIGDLASLGRRGFAFNALTSYSDADRRRDDLYYADPLELFDHCKRHVSRFVSLLHDAPLYEFTLVVTF
jgi:SAM-dependent methyltransferase